tara:strand:+ start:9643 stop:10524 length:882 start_codon:yes stop_codon:yes gene_type:complete
VNTDPSPFQPDSKGSGKALFSGSSSLFRFTIAAGLVVAISLPLIRWLDRPERIQCDAYVKAPEGISLIAHAGGGLQQGDYSNSKEALDQSLSHGFELFELDFNRTSDGALAIGHDWTDQYRYWNRLGWGDWLTSFFFAPSARSYEAATPGFGLTRLSLDTLLDWLRANPGRIVTDFKSGNIDGLAWIASRAGPLQHRFVPQIYSLSEYQAVRELGYDDVIFTSYRLPPTVELFSQIDQLDLFAITVPAAAVADAARVISKHRLFTHTINSPVTLPAAGYYTDCLIPAKSPDGI